MNSLLSRMGRNRAVPFILLLIIVALLLVVIPRARKPLPYEVVEIVPVNTGEPERCLTCHDGIEAMSASHATEEFGCVSCHGGAPLSLDEQAAHAGMVVNPGALEHAEQYCGTCHARQIVTVPRSIQATYAGAIGHVRRTFGLQPDDTAQVAVVAIDHLEQFTVSEHDMAPLQSFEANCLECHLHAEAIQQDYFYRSEGCSACHVLYNDSGLYEGGDPTIPQDEPGHPIRHEFTLAIPYTQCNHCHNRGNFDLRTMTFVERDDLPVPEDSTPRERRLHEYYQPIGEFTLCEWELDCIDCHTGREIMGDAVLYDNRTAAQYIQCQTCHGTLEEPPGEFVIESEEDLGYIRASINSNVDLELGDTVIDTGRGETFWHVQKEGDTWYATGKATGIRYEMPLVTGTACQQNPEEQESRYCHACHAFNREQPLQ